MPVRDGSLALWYAVVPCNVATLSGWSLPKWRAQTCPVFLDLIVLWGLHVCVVEELVNSANMLAVQLLHYVSA